MTEKQSPDLENSLGQTSALSHIAPLPQAGRGTLPEGPHPLGYGMEEQMRVAATIRLAHWAEWGDSMPGGDETLSSLSAGDVDGYLRMADAVIASTGRVLGRTGVLTDAELDDLAERLSAHRHDFRARDTEDCYEHPNSLNNLRADIAFIVASLGFGVDHQGWCPHPRWSEGHDATPV